MMCLSLTSFLGFVAVTLFTAKAGLFLIVNASFLREEYWPSSLVDTVAVPVYAVNVPSPDLTSTVPTPVYSVEGAGTLIWSAGGTLESGVTKYEVQNIQSLMVVHRPTETRTLFLEPVTVTCIVEQGDTIHHQFLNPDIAYATVSGSINPMNSWQRSGLKQECILDSDKKKAVCVDEWLHPDLTATVVNGEPVAAMLTHTPTTTCTGNITPVATLFMGGAKLLSGVKTAAAGFVLVRMAMGAYLV